MRFKPNHCHPFNPNNHSTVLIKFIAGLEGNHQGECQNCKEIT